MMNTPCAFTGVRIPCGDSNRHFRSQSCYDNHIKQIGAANTKNIECEEEMLWKVRCPYHKEKARLQQALARELSRRQRGRKFMLHMNFVEQAAG